MELQSILVYIIVGAAFLIWGISVVGNILMISHGDAPCDDEGCDGCSSKGGCSKRRED